VTQEKDDAERGTSGFLRKLHMHRSRCSMQSTLTNITCSVRKINKIKSSQADFLDTEVVCLVI